MVLIPGAWAPSLLQGILRPCNWVWSKGVADKNMRFIAPVARFKHLEGHVFPPSRHYNDTCIFLWRLYLQIWRFLWWQTDKTDCFTPCTCAWGNNTHPNNHICVRTCILALFMPHRWPHNLVTKEVSHAWPICIRPSPPETRLVSVILGLDCTCTLNVNVTFRIHES